MQGPLNQIISYLQCFSSVRPLVINKPSTNIVTKVFVLSPNQISRLLLEKTLANLSHFLITFGAGLDMILSTNLKKFKIKLFN